MKKQLTKIQHWSRHWKKRFGLILLLVLSLSCHHILPSATYPSPKSSQDIVLSQQLPNPQESKKVSVTQLVDIQTISPGITLDIRYATDNNFMRRKLYSQARCLLIASVAQHLAQVQADLERQGLGLKVYDCYRPLAVQKQMWQVMPDDRFVANPANGSRHNRGSAVDVTLVDRDGKELEMPTQFDDFTERAYSNDKNASASAKKHRQQLKQAMENHGFTQLKTEWWHFDANNWQKYPLLDVPFEAISQR
jgi:zinc D-Ala-D-Ala dipeptidase